jgi:asparagine synthase (glutamine-hydrolysing)
MQGNIQSVISRQVAEALGYEWHFIDYQIWTQKMNAQNILSAYLTYGFNGSSVSHLQDFPAVYALKEMSIIKENDIFVPGHALDFIAGSHLNHPMRTCNSIESVIPVIRKHFSDFSYHSMKRTAVFRHVHSVIGNYNLNPAQMAECFVWQERQTKFIANSVKVYEYFGYSWRIPEWDLELINYWEKIGFNYRYERNMFKSIFKKYLMMDLLRSIPFANDLYVKPKQTFKSIVSNNIPLWMKQAIKRTGITTSTYCVNEGSHLIHSDNSETIADYLSSFNAPMIVRKYLKPYFRKQNLARFGINTVTTLLNIRSTSSSYEPHINHFSHTILRKREPN